MSTTDPLLRKLLRELVAAENYAEEQGTPAPIVVGCEHCGNRHVAWYHHQGTYREEPVWAVHCPEDPEQLADFYTAAAALPYPLPSKRQRQQLDEALELSL